MKIVVMGAGRMGAWLVEEFCHDYEVAVFDTDPKKLKYFIKVTRLLEVSEIQAFQPELLVNAVTLKNTIEAFDMVLPYLSANCLLSDITSVKNGIYQYYQRSGRRFVSTHPMFGPTFANIRDLSNENAIIISESDKDGKTFFQNFYQNLRLNIFEYSFEEHDETTAYSLGTPFSSSLVFAACLKNQKAPGTTFKKHMEIVRGLLSEDDFLISEVLFNPRTLKQIERINSQLTYLTHIIRGRDYEEMNKFLDRLRENIQ
ncbi:MAG: prephenate dehydrogenase/arogenate dehydrogenase family protein [Candidatus Marinimicrobia bacterium CG08_land_8_20_14_0_20_45_22]|nr:MAG: prephenate dehydrogenase/arogenate dehydrogenase family protein [Candidatus Marinimicrobia bacterium CG08_land_8_20_14_0_20_45_22]